MFYIIKNSIKIFFSKVGYLLFNPNYINPILDPRTSSATKTNIAILHSLYKQSASKNPDKKTLVDFPIRIFSQFEEDGILLYLDAVLDLEPKTFIELGSSDGINSNCANLALNLGYTGLFIDGDKIAIERGKKYYKNHPDTWLYPPKFIYDFITKQNVNDLILSENFSGQIGVLSIDLDGNDYWIWDALNVIDPTIVLIETQSAFGMRNLVVPYNESHILSKKEVDSHYFSASPVAMTKLAKKKGYRLIGSNNYGFNLIFIKENIGLKQLPTIQVKSVLNHPRFKGLENNFEKIKDYKFETPIE